MRVHSVYKIRGKFRCQALLYTLEIENKTKRFIFVIIRGNAITIAAEIILYINKKLYWYIYIYIV